MPPPSSSTAPSLSDVAADTVRAQPAHPVGVTMKRVAAELGVSVTTISKVLNNHADIGEATRQRVLAKVEELGYRRNAVARSLTLRRTHTLGVIVSDLMHSFFVEVVAAIEASLGSRGYGLLLCNLGEDPAKERWQLEMLLERQVDGVILASANAQKNGDLLRSLQNQGKGLVLIDRDDHQGLRCHRVVTDDERVGRLATSHLVALGHQRIAHLAGPRLVHARRRQRGYLASMRQAGLAVDDRWVVEAGFVEHDGYEAARRLLARAPEVTAIFAVSDPAAIGAMKAAWDLGLRVPEDIAVVGAGDIAHGDLLRVPLTTVSWSRDDLGREAARLIIDQIEAHPDGPFHRVVVPPSLRVRASCGATADDGPSAQPAIV
jgi:LacI family transcriptional regulator